MLFLLGVRAHPAIRVLIGVVVLTVGAVLRSEILIGAGVLVLAYGGFRWYRRLCHNARREEARAGRHGAAR